MSAGVQAPAVARPRTMTRTAALVHSAPGYSRLRSAGGMVAMFGKTVRAAVTPPYTWLPDCLVECSVGIRRSVVPNFVSISAFALGAGIANVGAVIEVLGTTDRFGGAMITGWPREPSYWVTAMVFAGVVGSAITADLGARKIRDELDAIKVLGIDPIKSLVVPRVVALTLIAPVLGLIALLNSQAVLYLTAPLALPSHPPSAYVDSGLAFISSADLVSFVLRLLVTGTIVGVVSCYKGLSCGGGAEGVGKAVNESVLITFFTLWAVNSLWNAVFLALWPNVSVLHA